MNLRLATVNENFHRGDRPIPPGGHRYLGICQGGHRSRPYRFEKSRNLGRDPVGAPPVGALAPLSLNSSGIFIRSGEPQDHGNFVVNTWKQDPPQRHKDHKDGLLDGGGDGRGQIAFEFGNHFTFGPGLQKLSSGIVSPCPDLGKKILVAVAVEYELGFL